MEQIPHSFFKINPDEELPLTPKKLGLEIQRAQV